MYYVVYYAVPSVMQNKLILINHLCLNLVPVVGEIMKDFYPEVLTNKEFIAKVIKNEEERFHETFMMD